MADTVTITKKAYNELIKSQLLLQALEAAGVDSWEGYEIARESLGESYEKGTS